MYIVNLPLWFISSTMALMGLAFGSFANVLISRLPMPSKSERNVITKPSHCPNCQTKIRIQHNIPVISWLLIKGHCAYCGWPIPIFYPIVELISGFLFGGSVWLLPFGTLIWLKSLLCCYALMVLFVTDLNNFLLPDIIQIPLIGLGVLCTIPQLLWPEHSTALLASDLTLLKAKTFLNGLQYVPKWSSHEPVISLQASLLGLALGYLMPLTINYLYSLIRKQDGMGRGDCKMLAWLGSFWGYKTMLEIFFGGALLGTIISAYLVVGNKKWHQVRLPFGCLLAITTPLMVCYGSTILAVYLQLIS